MSKKNIGVIFGGVSSEHEVSKLSAKTYLLQKAENGDFLKVI